MSKGTLEQLKTHHNLTDGNPSDPSVFLEEGHGGLARGVVQWVADLPASIAALLEEDLQHVL